MSTVRIDSFRDQFRHTKYPFADSANLTTVTGYFISQELFLDITICVGDELVNLMLAEKTISGVVFHLGTSTRPKQYSFRIGLTEFEEENHQPILDTSGQCKGVVVYDATEAISLISWPNGEHRFRNRGIPFCISCYVESVVSGVTSLNFVAGKRLANNVCMIGSDGIILEQNDNVVTVHVMGDPLYMKKIEDINYVTPRFLTRLIVESGASDAVTPSQSYVCLPDDMGKVSMDAGNVLTTDDILRIYGSDKTVFIELAGT